MRRIGFFLLFTWLLTASLTAVAESPSLADIKSTLKQELCGGRGLFGGREATARDYEWDVLHADLFLYPHFATEILDGSVTFDCESGVDNLALVELDFADAMTVSSVSFNGGPISWIHAAHKISITVAPELMLGDPFTLHVEFTGHPEPTFFGSIDWTSHAGVPLVATLSEPEGSRDWWPCKDVPDDKFTADIRYRVPGEFKAPGPGLLQSVTDEGDGTSTWHWLESYPITTYLIAMTVTNYDHYTDYYHSDSGPIVPIENYVYPENYDDSVEDLSVTPEAMQMLVDRFGEYPFIDEKYGHMSFHWGGAMEHQTCTSYGDWLLSGTHYYDRIVVHELAHQWFGNTVTLQDWENVWLNEGFAKYSEALWFEHREGPSGLFDFMELITDNPYFDGPVYNNPSLFGGTVYRKGAWVLHMLRFIVDDDDAFFGALRYYLGEHYFGNAHTEDLRADLETFLGLELETYFAQWVYGLYRPEYEWSWNVVGGPGDWNLQVRIEQVQTNTGLFEMPLPIRVTTAGGDLDLRVDNIYWTQAYEIPLGADEPLDVELDPDGWILWNGGEVAWIPTAVENDDAGPLAVSALRSNWPNPFNPSTIIEFSLESAGDARLEIFDVRGRLVRTLIDGPREAGPQSMRWDGLDRRGHELPSGVYLARLVSAGGVHTQRMTMLK